MTNKIYLKDTPVGAKIESCMVTAIKIADGIMGTRVKIVSVPNGSGASLGKTIWSNNTKVKLCKK